MRTHWIGIGLALFGCSSDSGSTSSTPDGPSACTAKVSGGGVLLDFCPPPGDPGAKNILLSVSGETLANTGYDFPPATPDDVYFVDGWEIRYDRVLVTFDKVRLNSNPDKSPTDQSQMGDPVAEVDGPWAVDLHKGGPLTGADDAPDEAVAFATINGGSLDPTMRYAFSFDGVPATATARNVNLDADDLTAYQGMITAGYTALFVGTATWKGGTKCTTTDSSYDFTKLPPVVKFQLGFKAPASYLNAQNPAISGDGFPGEEHPRGIQTKANSSITAQVTFHLDHAFWESFVHDSPAHFDPFAAHYVGATGVPTAKLEDFVGVGFTPVKDKAGKNVPWRWCYMTPSPAPTGGLSFDTLSIKVDPNGTPDKVIRDFYDYTIYNHSTWGHLNADGLSFVKRGYPSPP